MMINAPWNADQVSSLNGYQKMAWGHPFTCPNRTVIPHRYTRGDKGILLATLDGWVCSDCHYIQDWAHDFMADWSWRN